MRAASGSRVSRSAAGEDFRQKAGLRGREHYFRKKGDVQWKLIAVRKRKFPYFDEAPLTVAGAPEVREYMAIGVIADEEIGQTSEIREVVYAG